MGWSSSELLPFFPPPRQAPQKVVTRETASSTGAGNIPQAVLGSPVAAILGRKRVPDANTIWTGNLRPLTQTTTTTTTNDEVDGSTTTSTTTTVETTAVIGYLVDIHMGICLGPDVHLVGIYVDNQEIWSGDIGPARSTFTIGANDTFLSGASCVFSGGAFDQAPEPDIDVPDYPGYVGTATLLMKDVRVDLPMGNLSFEVYRTPNPLALSSGDNVSGQDLNLISAAVEAMTNPWGWAGLDISNVDVAGLSDLAEALADEENFCSIKIGTDVTIAAVLKSIQAQAAMYFFQNPETALITGSLIRTETIDYAAVGRRFNLNNIIDIRNIQKSWWNDTVEQARGSFTERDADYNEVPVFVQNAANLSQSGRGRRTAQIFYPYAPNRELTLQLVSRDLAALSAPSISFTLVTNRDGAARLPGDIVMVTHPDYGLLNVPVIVKRVRKQPNDINNVVIDVQQAVFPNSNALFGAGGAGYDPGFNLTPQTPTGMTIIDAPYFFARARFGLTSNQVSPVVYPVILPRAANSVQYSFSAFAENVPGASGNTNLISDGLFPTYAQLQGSIGLYDGFDTGEIASVTVDSVINPINLVTAIGEQGVKDGRLFMIIGAEILSFESVTNNGDGSFTLNNVHRALLDTVPVAHSDNANVYIVNNNFNFVAAGFPYPIGYTPEWLVTSNSLTSRGKIADALAYSSWAPSSLRVLAPPRPHDTRVNGVRSSTPEPVTEGVSVTVTWRTRSRINQKVALQLDAADAAEVGATTQQHRVFHRSGGGTVTEIGTGAYSGNSATFTMPNVANGVGSIYVQAEVTLGAGLRTSIYQDRVPVDVS